MLPLRCLNGRFVHAADEAPGRAFVHNHHDFEL